jgi:hypothetical protein
MEFISRTRSPSWKKGGILHLPGQSLQSGEVFLNDLDVFLPLLRPQHLEDLVAQFKPVRINPR